MSTQGPGISLSTETNAWTGKTFPYTGRFSLTSVESQQNGPLTRGQQTRYYIRDLNKPLQSIQIYTLENSHFIYLFSELICCLSATNHSFKKHQAKNEVQIQRQNPSIRNKARNISGARVVISGRKAVGFLLTSPIPLQLMCPSQPVSHWCLALFKQIIVPLP